MLAKIFIYAFIINVLYCLLGKEENDKENLLCKYKCQLMKFNKTWSDVQRKQVNYYHYYFFVVVLILGFLG